MWDEFYIGLDLTDFENNGVRRPVSRVTLKVDSETSVTAGDDSGLELSADCPYATQIMADTILSAVRGMEYKMYVASDANIDPAAELGDGMTACGLYSVIARIDDDGSGYPTISAPGEEESEYEYPFVSPVKRKLDQIDSKVDEITSEIENFTNDLEDISKRIEEIELGGGVGGVAGVISFNGRDGEVMPQIGDYTEEIAEAIRYVDGTEKENDMIVALDFADRIRALKKLIGGGTGISGSCHLADNIPSGCGEPHGLLHLDYTLVTCATERIRYPFPTEKICLCDGNWAYGPPVCGNIDGLLHLDYTLVNCVFDYSVIWGY